METLPTPPAPEITFDDDGYPTEATLQAIRDWEGVNTRDLLEAVMGAWYWDDMAKETAPGLFVFATGGWSGNESLVDTLMRNPFVMGFTSNILTPGGLHIFAIAREFKGNIRALYDLIRDWAWAGGQHAALKESSD